MRSVIPLNTLHATASAFAGADDLLLFVSSDFGLVHRVGLVCLFDQTLVGYIV